MPFTPIIPFSTFRASSNEFALKNTQAKFTKLNVIIQARIFGSLIFVSDQRRWITSAMPCKKPQNTNVQPAPCQIPPIKNVANKFAQVRTSPPYFPQAGYRYNHAKIAPK